ncbi:hypothetical protein CCP1ISM_130013 [Azospirillaceae bacterium]
MEIRWSEIKRIAELKNLAVQWANLGSNYSVILVDGSLHLECLLPIGVGDNDTNDFEENFKDNGNSSLKAEVVTQYEKEDKVLRLAKAKGVVDPETNAAVVYVHIPGEFGSKDGRWLCGGYGIAEDYNPDDYVCCYVEDKDRLIAQMIALAINPEATEPLSDETIQNMGEIPNIGRAFPNYPLVQSYADWDQPPENQGWYFWPIATGSNTPPVGEVEINPIGGYGFAPSGFYIKVIYQRPEGVTTGTIRLNLDWGRKE